MSTTGENERRGQAVDVPAHRSTIRDVANRAGVSPSTVSHALSGRRSISEATKQRVFDAVEALEYGADPIAASLRRGKTQLIGLVLRPKDAVRGSLGGTDNFLRLIGSAAATALDKGWGFVHIPNTLEECDTTLPVDGYIVAHPYEHDPVLVQLRRTLRPVVTIDALTSDLDEGWNVSIDYDAGAGTLLEYFNQESSVATALITGTEHNHWNRAVSEKTIDWAGVSEALHSVTALYEGEGVGGSQRVAKTLIESGARRILTAPSRFAVGAVRAAHSLGYSVPGDIEIAAFTDSSMAASNRPSITAMDIHLDEAGVDGVELMLERLAGSSTTSKARTVTPDVHWRESTHRDANRDP